VRIGWDGLMYPLLFANLEQKELTVVSVVSDGILQTSPPTLLVSIGGLLGRYLLSMLRFAQALLPRAQSCSFSRFHLCLRLGFDS
jgi:hypothetical protein